MYFKFLIPLAYVNIYDISNLVQVIYCSCCHNVWFSNLLWLLMDFMKVITETRYEYLITYLDFYYFLLRISPSNFYQITDNCLLNNEMCLKHKIK